MFGSRDDPVTNLSDREVTVKADTVIATVETAVSLNSLSQEREEKERFYSDQLPSHRESLATTLSPRVSEKTKEEVRDTLIEFQDVFMCPDTQLGRTGKVRHTTDTANSKPVKLSYPLDVCQWPRERLLIESWKRCSEKIS